MFHEVEVKLRLQIDEYEISSGDNPRDYAERLMLEAGVDGHEIIDIHELVS